MDAKLCRKCGHVKPLSEFHKQPATRDGVKTVCKLCHHLHYRTLAEGRRRDERIAEGWVRPQTGNKRCFNCKRTLLVTAFGQDIKRADGLQARCTECLNSHRKGLRLRLKIEVLSHYSEGNPVCACCGEDHIEFLQIDHIAGDGAAQKRSVGMHGKSSEEFYKWLKRNGFPPGFRPLCANCNTALGFFGYCPHQRDKPETPC
jgi:hypothetical protein